MKNAPSKPNNQQNMPQNAVNDSTSTLDNSAYAHGSDNDLTRSGFSFPECCSNSSDDDEDMCSNKVEFFDFQGLVADIIIELKEVHHVTQSAISVICEKIKSILSIGRKYFATLG